ncbi:hypothetical protein PHYSODRAFT_563445 [Phytophthora sojae]|uniref:Uncharacterized protein n=1 Tax=Phytophthora sojae (strain P6497) TaxID=1094619 RepID=G4ZZM5_PHYSP|nr:hypothetical protein PHYSODRAFT_563445 [Phytophthora sojae]EGZ10371.1 hypothetical protein PHYSODRAFT_563445 [Phytophthora sojae]|eukprot:XP_009533116.1 hypothetical protein PHYSODRAFT_563445 [Phytophthora sojae]
MGHAQDTDEASAASSASTDLPTPQKARARGAARRSDSLDDLELSVPSLRLVAQQRGLDIAGLSGWTAREDGKLQDPSGHKYRSLRDALRAYTHLLQGAIPREDMYYLAILRRQLAELELPLVDGPISVMAMGAVVPEEHFYTSKKLFPIGYETLVNVQVTKPVTVAFRLRCKIVHGNKKKSPIFVVELERSAVEIVFRSYVANKAWKKALVHFESLSAEDLMAVVTESVFTPETDDNGNSVNVLTPASGEDGFGLLRRNITRVLEGLHQVLWCRDYQFWEQRHPITPDVHAKIRSRLKNQVKDILKAQNVVSRNEINRRLSQEALLEEHSRNPEDMHRLLQQKEKEQREADKRSVREAARKLLEIEMKAQEDAKEAQRRAKEERKNAILEAKMEAARQKEARKEAQRLAREQEKRMREEEKELKRVMREEEKRKKMEEKENSMKRRIEELRQRRQMREEQKAILENGVVTSSSPRRFSDSRKRKATADPQTVRQQQLALLKFVEEERERRRQIRVWDKRYDVESEVWARVKTRYSREMESSQASSGKEVGTSENEDAKFPAHLISAAVELDPVPAESHADLLFVWDFISTFSDCLKLTALPSLGVFVSMMTLSDGSSPVGDGDLDDESVGTLFASLHAELVKTLVAEYFPLLQMGNTLEEFHRTRPMNAFSWPELARQVCQLAIEFKHPSADEQLLKAIKGSKSYRDDAVTHPLRQRMYRRGTNLLKGVQFEEEQEEAETETQSSSGKNSITLASETNIASAGSSEYYGVVLVGGVSSKFKVGEKDQHLVDDNADMIQVGDYLMFINGQDVREMSLEGFNSLVNGLSTPHGLLMSSLVPVAKNPLKHIATTQGATKLKCCGFVLKLLRAKEIAAPFNQPVDAELYPDYYSSGDIAEPMDLGTIAEKIEDEDYENDDVESFVDDVQLVWKNCYTYNSLKAEISNLAQKLSVIFERLMKEWVYTTENRLMVAAEEDNCRNCQTIYAKGRLLLCDRCDAPYHTFCLKSPLSVIPKGEWFCPSCLADPSFSHEQFRKKARDSSPDSNESPANGELNESELTELEKRLLTAIDLLSNENYSKTTVSDRLKVLRVLCELIEETAAVQSVYHSLEDKANDARKKLGESLADLEREWKRFSPPRSSHGVEQTKKFIIDGVEHELTDELLTYLEDKAKAELDSQPIPALPESARKKLLEFGDRFLLARSDEQDCFDNSRMILSRPVCAFCGLEDGILNGPLHSCKQSPLTAHTTMLNHYDLPELLAGEGSDMLTVQSLGANDLANVILEDTVQGGVVYAVNDRVVFGMNRAAIQEQLRTAAQPILLYLTLLPGEAVRASVSIVKCHGLPLGLVLGSHDSFVFVQSYQSSENLPVGFGELSGQVFPGDVLLMVNGVSTRGKDVAAVEPMLHVNNPNDTMYIAVARSPSAKMKKAQEDWQRVVYDVPSQRAKESALRADVISPYMNGPISYEVVFQDGPLGLALALEPRGVVVKSLNDHPDGTLGQASLSGRISRGDLVERVNDATYGQLNDLSQFTSWLLSLPRPLKMTFSRQPPGGANQVTPEQANKRMSDLLGDSSLLCKALKLPASSDLKTFRVESFPLPFEAENFLENIGVIATNGFVYCEQQTDSKMDQGTAVKTVAIGDLIVGVNGRSIAGLNWASVKELCAAISTICPVYLHLSPFVRPVVLLQAHESCVESANVAWSECGSMLPQIEKVRELESFIKWLIIPRTLSFGKCRHGYSFYRFFSDLNRLFVLSPDKKWSVCATKEQLSRLLAYLEEDTRDAKIAAGIKWCFHWVLHEDAAKLKLQQGSSCCEYSSNDFIRDGPFGIEKEVLLAMDGDMEKYESLVKYRGRKFFLGSFYSQQEAENALQRAESAIRSTGFHAVIAPDASTLRNAHFPSSLTAPYPKAENVVKRILSRKYEYGSVMDGQGGMKPIPISHDVYQILKRGLRSNNAMLNQNMEASRTGAYQAGMPPIAMSRMQGDLQSSAYAAAQARYQEALKRKYAQAENPYAQQIADQMKRTRYDPSVTAKMQQQFAPATAGNAVSFKRSLQALVDQGRAMLAAWNQFAASASVQTTNGLAYACLSSFEEVKKVVSRIVVDPNAAHPDPKTFVCLHHAYVMGLICAMATQALTTSQKTHSDSSLVKQVADAFATAILSCVDPSNMLRARALSGFAAAAKKCEPSQRASDLSMELHNVANFVLMFLRTTRYLSGATFDDLTSCRPLFTASTPGVEALPASFVQQVNLLENIREAFSRKTTNSQPTSQNNNTGTLVDVEFGFGPLGVVINYSQRGTIIVTEFSNDNNNMMGQTQASGKVQVGDEVYAVNGNMLAVIGMEGFKAEVASGKRPLRVTFRRLSPADQAGGGYQAPATGQFPGMGENVNPFPYQAAPSNQPMGDPSSQFGDPQMAGFMGDMSAQSFPAAPMGGPGYDALPNMYGNGVAGGPSAQPSGAWQNAANPMAQSFRTGPTPNGLNMNSGGNVQLPLNPMPLMPSASAPMGYSTAPPPSSAAPNSYQSNTSNSEFVNFVAANDPQLPPDGGDPSQVTFYDANGTTYRGAADFEIDTTANAIADVDTEPESPSISQLTTPAQSDTDGERTEADLQRDREAQLAALTAASNALQSQSSEPPLQTSRASPRGGKELRLTEETASRRSSRVSRKITNIGEMYDPDFVKSHSKGGSGSEAGTDEPTDGDIGELCTELLEPFRSTIRPLKKDTPRSLLLLRAQLLEMESAIPRDAFRSGKWGRSVRAAWAELVYTCDVSARLMEAVVLLEANIDPEWLDPGWKASPLPSAKNAIATSTIASAAMRLYSLDDAISYGRMKRGGKRKHRNPSSASSSRPGSPVKTAIISQEAKSTEPVSNPSELPFVGRLSTGLVTLVDKMISNILEAQRERASSTYASRKARSEVAAITSLTEDQVEQWIQASSAQQASTSGQSQSGSGRHSTPKRKHPGLQPTGSTGQHSSSGRKRRAQGSANVPTPVATPPETQYVELRCFQMKTLQHCFPMGSAQDMTLRSRLEYIMDTLLRNELALAFSAPVNVNEVPGYAELIKHPMDLGTIKIRLSRGFYDQRFEMLVRDVNLVWENCFTFNRLDADISAGANRLRSIFNRLFEQWITDVPPNTPVTHLASEELCRQCGQMNAQESMLLCDSCDAAYHAFCLQPPLAAIPPGNWYCPRCPVKKLAM